jgi:hypothetical protein
MITTICWTLSYIISIWVRHSSHRVIVFGEYEGTYFSSLLKTYITYSSSIIVSMFSNHFFVSWFLLSHQQAWIITYIKMELILREILLALQECPPGQVLMQSIISGKLCATNHSSQARLMSITR